MAYNPITDVSLDTSPQLGGVLDANGHPVNYSRATVASHATTADIWGAAGNQINWTGTATTTAFPNAPQAGAERVLICAGACSFTAGANMLIDGVASAATVTCAANDQVIVRAVSTTQFKLSRIKYDGTPQASVGDHAVKVHTGNGHGAVNTMIRRYTTVITNVGTAITYADSANNGASFTINEDGIYAIKVADSRSSSSFDIGVSLNSAALTTAIASIAIANRIGLSKATSAGVLIDCTTTVKLVATDVIRPHDDGATDLATDVAIFEIRKVAAL